MTSGLRLKIAVPLGPDFAARHLDWLTAVPLVFLLDGHGVIKYKRAGERGDEYDALLIKEFSKKD